MVTASLFSQSSQKALTPGAIFRQYKLLEQIGFGGQGVVWSALHEPQKRIYAIKFNETPESDEGEADDIRDEHQLERLIKLRQSHILPVTDYGFEEKVRFTVSPYLPGGTLAEVIKAAPLSTNEILRYGAEVASALDYLHNQGIIHRDLKASNIFLDMRARTYLADFGLARMVSTSTMAFHTGHGTPPYAPPEQIQMKAITRKSDIFSFGILLYELLTGQLPWGGKRQLGMEQTQSRQEIPDPRELNESLPPRIVEALRRITSAIPGERPNSAGEAMKMFYYIFNVAPDAQPKIERFDETTPLHKGVKELLESGLSRWELSDGIYNLGLTKFVLIDLDREKIDKDLYGRFMLSQSLTYGYNSDHWWAIINNTKDRLAVSSRLLNKNNEAITARVIEHMIGDMNTQTFPKGLPSSMIAVLLDIGTKTENVFLRQQIFEGLRTLTRPRPEWNNKLLGPEQTKRLGRLALEDSDAGDTTAELIGHLRVSSAVQTILKHADDERKVAALLLIQKVAGSLPPDIQGSIRVKLLVDWVIFRMLQQPVNLISAYMLTFLGAALGIGLQVYTTYNFPNFLDTVRFTTSLEQGLIIGAIFGLGIFMTRVIVERFNGSNALLRVLFGTIAGSLGMNIGLLVFHILFVNTPPSGFSITAACMLIALTFAIGGLIRLRWIRMILSTLSVFTAVIGTWWIHLNLAASPVDLTPVFRYDYSWPLTQVIAVALVVAVPIGIFGNLVNLSLLED